MRVTGVPESSAAPVTSAIRSDHAPPPSSETSRSGRPSATEGPCRNCSTPRPSLATYAASRIFSAPSAAVHWLIPPPMNSMSRAGGGASGWPSFGSR
jgi:hypothetical protein